MTTRRSILLTGLAGLAILVAACGGSTGSAAPTGAATTDGPTASAAPSVALPSADASAIALPSFDAAAILENLEGIDSYRITMATDGEVGYSAVVVTKPDLSRDIRLGTGDDAQRIVVIGDEAWTEAAPGTWQALPPELAGSMLMAFDPIVLAGGFAQPGAWTGAADQGTEERNGVQARHYRIEAGSLVGTLASMPPGSSIDAWIAEDGGYLIALEVVGEGGEGFVIDVSGINDPANVVERPV